MRLALLAFAAATTAGGCIRAAQFHCDMNADCVHGGIVGTCEAVGYCSFADATCVDGRRFGDASGMYSGQCVGAALDDGGLEGLPCTPVTGAFSTPTLVAVLNDPVVTDGTPSMTEDRLEIYFKSSRVGGAGQSDVWRSTRATTTSAWSVPVPVTELNTTAEDASPEVARDGLTIWYSSQRTGGQGNRDIWVASRPNRTSAWSTPNPVVELNTSGLDDGFVILPSMLVAYLHSTRGGRSAFYRTTRPTQASAWAAPVLVPGQDLASDSENAWVSPDECAIYFASNRVGGGNNYDLYVAERASTSAALGPATKITDLSSAGWDDDVWLSGDQRYIMFDSNRVGGGNQFDLYEATR
jgi:hypothetical protein